MKPLERIFFLACVNEQICMKSCNGTEFSIRAIANIFSRLGFSYKQLCYYLEKWSEKGFYNYGVSLDLGWLEIDKLTGEYKNTYEEFIQKPKAEWKQEEFAEYILKETYRTRRVTNFYIKNKFNIKDDGFYN